MMIVIKQNVNDNIVAYAPSLNECVKFYRNKNANKYNNTKRTHAPIHKIYTMLCMLLLVQLFFFLLLLCSLDVKIITCRAPMRCAHSLRWDFILNRSLFSWLICDTVFTWAIFVFVAWTVEKVISSSSLFFCVAVWICNYNNYLCQRHTDIIYWRWFVITNKNQTFTMAHEARLIK